MEEVDKSDSPENQILRAAFDIFIEKGLQNARMQDIADRVGMTRTVVNYYFRSKEKLLRKIAKNILHAGIPEMFGTLNSDLPLFDKIERFTSKYMDAIIKNPFMPLFLVNEIGRPDQSFIHEIIDGMRLSLDGFKAQVEQEIESNRIIDIDPLQLYITMISMCAYPVIGKNVLMAFTNTDEASMHQILEDRKKLVAQMIIRSIRI